MGGKPPIVADEKKRRACLGAFPQQQIEKRRLALGIEGRSRFVGNDDLGATKQGSRRGYPLLLADAQVGDLPLQQTRGRCRDGTAMRSASSRSDFPPPVASRRRRAENRHGNITFSMTDR